MYQAARALGFPPCNDAGLAAGTKLAYSTVYKWSKMLPNLQVLAAKEQKQAQPPKEGHVEEEQALHALE